MSDNLKLAAVTRTEFGKGGARRTRRAGLIPATIHAHGATPVHISLPGHATTLALRHANALLEVTVDEAQAVVLALPREVQRHPFRDYIQHVDLQAVRKGEQIEVEVPLHLEGEPVSGIAILDTSTVRVLAEATSLPESIVVTVTGLNDGDVIHARQLVLPEGTSLVGDGEEIILSVALPRSEVEATETAEADEESPAAEA